MPTNEERCEVAHNLRETSDAISDWGDSNPYWYVMKCVYGDVEIHNDNELLYRLADLIEPEPERTCHFEPDVTEIKYDENDNEIETGEPAEDCSAFECSECGYPMLYDPDIGWFDYCEPYKPHFKYCCNCGAKVIHDELHD